MCKCAARTLGELTCENELTARVKITHSYQLRGGSTLYAARVQQVFRGEAGRTIWIEAPRACGVELQVKRSYAVALNQNEHGNYTTFACGSFVSLWSDLSEEDHQTLLAPACSVAQSCEDAECAEAETCVLQEVQCFTTPCYPVPSCVPASAQQDELCYRFSETQPELAVARVCAEGLSCTRVSERMTFSSELYCKPLEFCISDASAAADCADLLQPYSLGSWGCVEHACSWRTHP